MRTRITGAIAGLFLMASMSAAPAAAETVNESLEVLPWLTVEMTTGDVSYGSVTPGASDVPGSTASNGRIASNSAVTIQLEGSAFSGPEVLSRDMREIEPWNRDEWPAMTTTLHPDLAATGDVLYPTSFINGLAYFGVTPNRCDYDVASLWCPFGITTRVDVPADALAGAYDATLEWTFVSS